MLESITPAEASIQLRSKLKGTNSQNQGKGLSREYIEKEIDENRLDILLGEFGITDFNKKLSKENQINLILKAYEASIGNRTKEDTIKEVSELITDAKSTPSKQRIMKAMIPSQFPYSSGHNYKSHK